jgi:hypothetical protein
LILGMGILAIGIGAVAQSDLDAFPLGTTTMVYHVTSEEMSEPQVLELAVTVREDGRYTVRMVTEQTGDEDELASGFGFIFGAASVSSGAGHNVSYTSLQALMSNPSRIQEGQPIVLGARVDFTGIVSVEIATVWCFEGTIVDRDEPDARMTVAVPLTSPVYISPRIRAEELRDGVWVETFLLELIEYTVTEGEG